MTPGRTDSVFRSVLRPWVQMARYSAYRLRPSASHSADSEDLAALALLGSVTSFLDVGANDGRTGSNSLFFALRGAQGLCIEPDPYNFRRLRAFYRLNRKVRCIEVGLSDREGFVAMRCDGLLSSIDGQSDPALQAHLAGSGSDGASMTEVRIMTMGTLFEEVAIRAPVDVLSIDVEGHELKVLLGHDWRRFPEPARCIIVETHADGANGAWLHQDFDGIATLLESHGYVRACASGNNTFWIHKRSLDSKRLTVARDLAPHFQWMLS